MSGRSMVGACATMQQVHQLQEDLDLSRNFMCAQCINMHWAVYQKVQHVATFANLDVATFANLDEATCANLDVATFANLDEAISLA